MSVEKEIFEVKIEKQDHFGRGFVRINQIPTFVENAVAGDFCRIEITEKKKKYQVARIQKIITPSKNRVEPACPYYNICGGCHLMEMNRKTQLQEKETKVAELLERIAGISHSNIFPIVSNSQFFYRNKVIFHGNFQKIGFYQEKTNQIVPIDSCMITKKEINEGYQQIQNYLKMHPNDSIQELMIRSNSSQEILIAGKGKIEIEKILDFLPPNSSFVWNQKLIKGKGYLIEDIFGMKFQIYPTSFFQVNYEIMQKMYQLVISFYQKKKYHLVLDLYCGTGTIGMLVSPFVEKVIGVEKEESSIRAAIRGKETNHISNIEFLAGKVEDFIDDFEKVDSVIVDPPRSGLDSHSISILLKMLPKTITYISCDPSTLARDLKILLEKYQLLEVHPFDMFPNTYHVECVCVLKLR